MKLCLSGAYQFSSTVNHLSFVKKKVNPFSYTVDPQPFMRKKGLIRFHPRPAGIISILVHCHICFRPRSSP